MSTLAKSGHGALIAYEQTPGNGIFTDFAEMGDVTPPALMRNEFDATTQNEDIDSYVLGVLRRSPTTFKVNFLPTSQPTHDHLTGLYSLIIGNITTGFRFTLPDSWIMIASGQVQNVVPHAPVDGLQSADITLRFSGKFYLNGVLIG